MERNPKGMLMDPAPTSAAPQPAAVIVPPLISDQLEAFLPELTATQNVEELLQIIHHFGQFTYLMGLATGIADPDWSRLALDAVHGDRVDFLIEQTRTNFTLRNPILPEAAPDAVSEPVDPEMQG